MPKLSKVAFEWTGEDGHFQFHDAEGRAHFVRAGTPFETSEPAVIELLDGQPGVKRAPAKTEAKAKKSSSSSSSEPAEPDEQPADEPADGGGS